MMPALIVALTATSCKKDALTDEVLTAAEIQVEVASVQAVAVAAVAGTTDLIYVINTCERSQRRDSVAAANLRTSITTYLIESYAGYTFKKAFAVKNSNGNIAGYVVVIEFNGKPIGLRFNADGIFQKVLEQREGRDLRGNGFHHGGRFDDRDGRRRDTIALAALPATIKLYFATNHASDTLKRAFAGRDGSIVMVSINNGAYATVFTTAGIFLKRVALPAKPGRPEAVELTVLPATAQQYLSTTYPNYVFKHAFKIMANATLQGYVVLIDANTTKYAVEFDATGNFVKAITVR